MTAYYNENDAFAAQWLRNLIKAEHIAPGIVDERSIVDVTPSDVTGFTQVHLFAGIGGWSLAARLAGWPDSRRIWTGSCPCQPYSAAGKRKGAEDARNLWPEMRRLVRACRPDVVAGEQVASKDGRVWLAGVRTDLEDVAYDFWSADSCAASVGAPHIRQRLWWLANPNGQSEPGLTVDGEVAWQRRGGAGGMADASDARRGYSENTGTNCSRQGEIETGDRSYTGFFQSQRNSAAGRLADTDGRQPRDGDLQRSRQHGQRSQDGGAGGLADLQCDGRQQGSDDVCKGQSQFAGDGSFGFWSRYAVAHCTDGKARRFEPGSFPLAYGVSGRVGRLRAYGNAINPFVAAEVLAAYLDGPV